MNIREALPEEADLLTQLAFASKSYWGYESTYLEAAREHMTITEEEIIQDHIYIIENAAIMIGFYELSLTRDDPELVWFFVHPQSIGQGIGTMLWKHLLETVKVLGVNEFLIKSDPHAEAFYLKQGVVRVGYKPSAVDPDMSLPLLKYSFAL